MGFEPCRNSHCDGLSTKRGDSDKIPHGIRKRLWMFTEIVVDAHHDIPGTEALLPPA